MTETDRFNKDFPVSWEELHRDARALAWRLAEIENWKGVVAIARGGLRNSSSHCSTASSVSGEIRPPVAGRSNVRCGARDVTSPNDSLSSIKAALLAPTKHGGRSELSVKHWAPKLFRACRTSASCAAATR